MLEADDGVVGATHAKFNRHWSCWEEFLAMVDLRDDPFLDDFTRLSRIRILAGFASAFRDRVFSPDDGGKLVSGTVTAAVDDVAKRFRDNDRPDPRHDASGKAAHLLQRQKRGHLNQDPSTTHQKAITPQFLRYQHQLAVTTKEKALAQLATGAFFFAMRSCEYLSVSGARRTRLLELQNIRFFKANKELLHNDPRLCTADTVSITFYFQKNDERDDTVTMWRTTDELLCPVRI